MSRFWMVCRREEGGGVLEVGMHAEVCVVHVGAAGEKSGVVLFCVGRRVFLRGGAEGLLG